MIDLEVYIIRHKPTGDVMPERMHRSARRGWSNWEPSQITRCKIQPRIFFTHGAAVRALSAWLMGVWYRSGGWSSGSPDNPPEYDEYVDIKKPLNPRVKEDMEIVELFLEEIPEDEVCL
jgi:hypothetical protein